MKEVQNIGDLIYSNVWGPAYTESLQGNQYYIIFVNAASRYSFIAFMKTKDQAVDKYIVFSKWLFTQKNLEIKRIHFDNGKELINKKLQDFCKNKGTEITTTAPYSSQQNGPAEHCHRTLTE
jgi:transposase InsO family protein